MPWNKLCVSKYLLYICNMKKCTKCGNEFLENSFPTINNKTGKKSSMCLSCKRQYDREYYKNNTDKNKKIKLQNERIENNRKKYIDILKKVNVAIVEFQT